MRILINWVWYHLASTKIPENSNLGFWNTAHARFLTRARPKSSHLPSWSGPASGVVSKCVPTLHPRSSPRSAISHSLCLRRRPATFFPLHPWLQVVHLLLFSCRSPMAMDSCFYFLFFVSSCCLPRKWARRACFPSV
jgi:hypothetical protein